MCRLLKSKGSASIYSRVFNVDDGTNSDGSANTGVIVYYILVSNDSVIQINPPINKSTSIMTFSEFIKMDEERKNREGRAKENKEIFGLNKITLLFINKRYNQHFQKKDFKNNINKMFDYILNKENEQNEKQK